ncbi:MAG: hypothetical protein A3J54_04395 [Candidatus Ryanbacteria bacterium RIFCSPHIGHO2_02_FULL_45_13b]|uniref:Bacterial type II secretion system protein E domain-containing protein n=1 Tax=Candidatus Ryanbacteria bacterium RIFCSPHIGHO2_02_FULL_45_13b TaxID=1802117 RepID=A0A1G2G4G9_9BACT|nr:MAG: hypothetical protein A3J54_04395 [Candidatus Ryanbacteria bacterium RIFCSPHIGHO2_02_FULL_45_13b]
MPRPDDETVEEHLRSLHLQEEEDLARVLSEKYHLPYLNLSAVGIDTSALLLIPEAEAREAELVVFHKVGKKIQVAIRNPNSQPAKHILEGLKEKHYVSKVFMVSRHSLEQAWETYKEAHSAQPLPNGIVVIDERVLPDNIKTLRTIDQFRNILEPFVVSEEERHMSLMLEVLLEAALILEVSDIHIKPEEETTRLRVRIDGVLHDVLFFSTRIYNLILSRIKLLSGIKLNIKQESQDGRFTINRKGEEDIEVRTSTLPGSYGESVVIRVLDPKLIALSLENLGMQQPVLALIQAELNKPNGMILTTGPTGAGKTTTLYAFIKHINSPDINIISIEDPIEYHLKEMNQTQVDEERGYTFSNGLRSIVRQDPDVILVGEIRDLETAEIAMHAALTGHLVFSTLHTNNAPGTIPRLIDLGVRPNIIAPAINLTMAQRLVRRLCGVCRETYTPGDIELRYMREVLEDLPQPYIKPNPETQPLWRARGCDACGGIGYKGRISIFEVFLINDEIEHLILQTPSESDIRDSAKRQGMLTMQQDGILKSFAGITAIDEVMRVTGEAKEE